MEVSRKELSLIKEVLKSNPRGMTVTEIAKEIKMNRHSVAKYLEILVVSGHIEMKSFGPSKVYYISQRLPISAMLRFSSDFIIILDKSLRIVDVNDRFLEFTKLKREDIINQNMETFSSPIEFEPSILPSIKDALGGKESIVDASYKKKNTETYFLIKFIPTVFDDGEKGATVIFENITQRKQSEKAIRESEEKFRSVIEQSSDGIVLTDEKGKIIEINRGLEAISGYTRDNNLGKYIWDSDIFGVMSADESRKAHVKKAIERMLKTGSTSITKAIEGDIRRKDGEIRTIQIVIFPIKTEKGFKLGGIVRDITERKRIEIALRNSEEQFRTLAESTSSGIVIAQGIKLLYANNAALNILGYSLAELQEIKIVDLVPPNYVSLVAAAVMSYKKNMRGFEAHYELKANTKAGKVIWVDLTTSEFNFQGKPAIIITFIDITGRRQIEEELQKAHDELELHVKERTRELEKANSSLQSEIDKRISMEEALRQSESRYRNLVEKIDDWVWEVDENCVFTYSSPKVKDILGYTPDEIVGKSVFDLLITEDRARVTDIITKASEGRQPLDVFENTLIHKDGHPVIAEVSGMPIFDETGVLKGYRGADRDVTTKKQAEEKLRWSETFIRTMTDNSPLAFYAVDNRDGRILYYNKLFVEIWNLSKIEPFIGTGIVKHSDLISYESSQVEDTSAFLDSCARMGDAEGREVTYDEISLKDGRIIRRFSVQIRDDEDRYLGRLYIFEDITERKRAEEALWESQRFLTTLIGNLPGMIYRCHDDDNWTMQYVSDGCYKLTGYQTSDLLANKHISYEQIVHPEDRKRVRDEINQALSGCQPFQIEYRIITASGNIKWVWEQGCSIKLPDSEEKMIEGYITDITEKKAIEEKLSALASFPEMNPNPIIEINTDGQIVYMNPATKKTFTWLGPGHPMISGLDEVIDKFKSGSIGSHRREVKLDHSTYSQFIYYVPGKDLVRIYAANITQRKHAEEEAQAFNRALRMVNDCSQALVRATDEQTLLQDICRIVVEEGGYRMAWVGFAQNDEGKSIMPAARTGYDNGYVDNVKASWGDNERSRGPTGTAVKTGKPSVARYTTVDPGFSPWREEALQRGYASTVALPLVSNQRAIGALNIYSANADAFDSAELKLLMELADDLTYGIMSLRTRAEHAKAEEMLRLMKFTIDRINDAAFWLGDDGHIYYVNEAASRDLGYSQEELLQMSVSDVNTIMPMDKWPERWEQIKKGKLTKIRGVLRKKDGTLLPVEITSNYIDFNGKQYDFAFTRPIPETNADKS